MHKHFKYLFINLIFGFVLFPLYGQNSDTSKEDYFIVRGSVKEQFSYKPILEASVQVNGGIYARTDFDGNFTITIKFSSSRASLV